MRVFGLYMLWILVGGARGEWTVLMFTCIFITCEWGVVIVVIYICWSWCIFFEEKVVIGALALILTDGNT